MLGLNRGACISKVESSREHSAVWDGSGGAEAAMNTVEEGGLAVFEGDGDNETVTFTVHPDPAHV